MPAYGSTSSSARSEPDRPRKEAAPPRRSGRAVTALDRALGQLLFVAVGRAIRVVLWDGRPLAGAASPEPAVRVEDRAALLRLLARPGIEFGELYSDGRVAIDGDLVEALERVYRALGLGRSRFRAPRWARRAAAPSLVRSRRNIHHHYDLSNEFYALWLDREAMQYTCAYYPDAAMSLEAAQRAKMEHVCRKVWLRPGDRVVEAGCGWGGLALYMARRYGAHVRAFNISREQIAHARLGAERAGLGGRVEFVEDDYRNIRGRYDVFVSVGMLEHVGPGHYAELGRVVDRCLAPDGRGLIHSIGRDRPAPLNGWIRRRIFPGAYPPTLGEMTGIFEAGGLSVLDVENLRLHYASTLRQWLERFERNAERIRATFGERFVRTWRLYLAGSVAAFDTGTLQLFQAVFARTGGNRIPSTRRHLYHDAAAEPL